MCDEDRISITVSGPAPALAQFVSLLGVEPGGTTVVMQGGFASKTTTEDIERIANHIAQMAKIHRLSLS